MVKIGSTLDKFGPSDESEGPNLLTVFSSQPLDPI